MTQKSFFNLAHFRVTCVPSDGSLSKGTVCVRFRIPRGCINAVKRNSFKRVVRDFIHRHPPLLPRELIFHVYKQHLTHETQWQKFIEGVRYDLCQFLKHQKWAFGDSHQKVYGHAPVGCAFSA